MAFGSFNKNGELKTMSEINVTPFVDVMLVLLIIFMLTIPLLTHNLPVAIPKTDEGVIMEKPPVVTLVINADNQMFWNDVAVNEDALKQKLSVEAQKKPQPEVRLIADQRVLYGFLASVIGDIKGAGLWQLNFVTLTPQGEKKQNGK
jgi:biopolymer transport protein ExbD